MECLLDCPRIKQSMGTNFVEGCLSLLEKRRHLRGRDKRWSEIDRSVSQSCWHKVWNCFHKVTITPALWSLNVSFSLWQCERDHWWVSILFRANPTNLFSFVVCSFQITEHLLEELVFISFWLRTRNQEVTSATLTTSKSTLKLQLSICGLLQMKIRMKILRLWSIFLHNWQCLEFNRVFF